MFSLQISNAGMTSFSTVIVVRSDPQLAAVKISLMRSSIVTKFELDLTVDKIYKKILYKLNL